MAFNFGVNKPVAVKKKTNVKFGFGVSNTPTATTPVVNKNIREAGFPADLGGGRYLVSNTPGELILTPRSQDALPAKGTIERDHIISVALGGTSGKENLQYLATTDKGRQSGKMSVEQQAINDYTSGKISLGEARLRVQTKQQQLLGLTPTDEEQTVEGQLKKKFGALGSVIGKVGKATEKVIDTVKKPFVNKQEPMRFEVGQGLYEQQKTQAKEVINYEVAKGQEERQAMPVSQKIKTYQFGLNTQQYKAENKALTPDQQYQRSNPTIMASAKAASRALGEEIKPENYIERSKSFTEAERQLVDAYSKEDIAEVNARVATAPIRFLAGYPAAAVVSYALEKADSDLSVDPKKVEGQKGDVMRLLIGDTEVKRLMKSDDLYGILGRAAGMPIALGAMAILENPFIVGTGIKGVVKAKIKGESAEQISKLGMKGILSMTDDAIKAELKAGNITKEVAEQTLEEIGLPKSLSRGIKPAEVKIVAEAPKKVSLEPKIKPQNARGEVLQAKTTKVSSEVKPVLKTEKIDSINPTGGINVKYTPEKRATAELGDNITTFDKTSNKLPDEEITIYRGTTKNQKEIVSGDFITTNKQLAKDYAGNGVVIEKKVKAKDILDDITEPLGEEYIYRPNKAQEKTVKSPEIKIEKTKASLPKPKKEPIKYVPIEKPVDLRKKIKVEKVVAEPSIPRKIEKETIEKGLVDSFKGLDVYDKVNMKEQATGVAKLIETDYDKAVRIALGKELPTGNILPESVLIGVKNQALKNRDTDLLIRLATDESGVAKGTTLLGQRIKALDEGLEDDAFRNIRKVVENRKVNLSEKSAKTAKDVRAKAIKTIAEAKPNKYDWANLISELTCK